MVLYFEIHGLVKSLIRKKVTHEEESKLNRRDNKKFVGFDCLARHDGLKTTKKSLKPLALKDAG